MNIAHLEVCIALLSHCQFSDGCLSNAQTHVHCVPSQLGTSCQWVRRCSLGPALAYNSHTHMLYSAMQTLSMMILESHDGRLLSP